MSCPHFGPGSPILVPSLVHHTCDRLSLGCPCGCLYIDIPPSLVHRTCDRLPMGCPCGCLPMGCPCGCLYVDIPPSHFLSLRVIVYVTHIEIVVCGVLVLFLSSLSLSLSLLQVSHLFLVKPFKAQKTKNAKFGMRVAAQFSLLLGAFLSGDRGGLKHGGYGIA